MDNSKYIEAADEKIDTLVQMLVYPPDFTKNIYDDPKGMYDTYSTYAIEIIASMERAGIAGTKHIITASTWKTETYFEYAISGVLTDKNAAISELTMIVAYFKSVHETLVEIIQKFEAVFDVQNPQYEEYDRVSQVDKVFVFNTKKDMLKYARIDESAFDKLEIIQLDDLTFPLLTNTLRFHGYRRITDGFRRIRIFEAYRNCTELENGKWAVILGV